MSRQPQDSLLITFQVPEQDAYGQTHPNKTNSHNVRFVKRTYDNAVELIQRHLHRTQSSKKCYDGKRILHETSQVTFVPWPDLDEQTDLANNAMPMNGISTESEDEMAMMDLNYSPSSHEYREMDRVLSNSVQFPTPADQAAAEDFLNPAATVVTDDADLAYLLRDMQDFDDYHAAAAATNAPGITATTRTPTANRSNAARRRSRWSSPPRPTSFQRASSLPLHRGDDPSSSSPWRFNYATLNARFAEIEAIVASHSVVHNFPLFDIAEQREEEGNVNNTNNNDLSSASPMPPFVAPEYSTAIPTPEIHLSSSSSPSPFPSRRLCSSCYASLSSSGEEESDERSEEEFCLGPKRKKRKIWKHEKVEKQVKEEEPWTPDNEGIIWGSCSVCWTELALTPDDKDKDGLVRAAPCGHLLCVSCLVSQSQGITQALVSGAMRNVVLAIRERAREAFESAADVEDFMLKIPTYWTSLNVEFPKVCGTGYGSCPVCRRGIHHIIPRGKAQLEVIDETLSYADGIVHDLRTRVIQAEESAKTSVQFYQTQIRQLCDTLYELGGQHRRLVLETENSTNVLVSLSRLARTLSVHSHLPISDALGVLYRYVNGIINENTKLSTILLSTSQASALEQLTPATPVLPFFPTESSYQPTTFPHILVTDSDTEENDENVSRAVNTSTLLLPPPTPMQPAQPRPRILPEFLSILQNLPPLSPTTINRIHSINNNPNLEHVPRPIPFYASRNRLPSLVQEARPGIVPAAAASTFVFPSPAPRAPSPLIINNSSSSSFVSHSGTSSNNNNQNNSNGGPMRRLHTVTSAREILTRARRDQIRSNRFLTRLENNHRKIKELREIERMKTREEEELRRGSDNNTELGSWRTTLKRRGLRRGKFAPLARSLEYPLPAVTTESPSPSQTSASQQHQHQQQQSLFLSPNLAALDSYCDITCDQVKFAIDGIGSAMKHAEALLTCIHDLETRVRMLVMAEAMYQEKLGKRDYQANLSSSFAEDPAMSHFSQDTVASATSSPPSTTGPIMPLSGDSVLRAYDCKRMLGLLERNAGSQMALHSFLTQGHTLEERLRVFFEQTSSKDWTNPNFMVQAPSHSSQSRANN